jgi:hypothetical protein
MKAKSGRKKLLSQRDLTFDWLQKKLKTAIH